MPVASACAPAKPYRQGDAHADPAPGSPAAARSKLYNPRHPERTVLYRAVAGHLQTGFALSGAGQVDGQGDQHPPLAYVAQAFRKYLECGILAHGFARLWCEDCAHDYLIALSCKGRAVCPSCNARRMDETAAHLVDHVFPHLPVRQWVLSVPKRLRYFMQRDRAALNSALRTFLRVIEHCLLRHWRPWPRCRPRCAPASCARPPFALERLRQRGAELVYHCPKPQSGGKQADLVLRSLALIERIAALVPPPPRTHRHRYYGVLAPNAPLRAVVTAMAQAGPAQGGVGQSGTGEGASGSVLLRLV